MVTHTVHNFPVGTYVESVDDKISNPFVGTVVGLTVNAFGEPVLSVHMTCRLIRSMAEKGMIAAGWTEVAGGAGEFWERVGPVHPSNVQRLGEKTFLREKE